MASHTLLGLPVMKQLGLSHIQASLITLGATIFTDIASMLVLAKYLAGKFYRLEKDDALFMWSLSIPIGGRHIGRRLCGLSVA